jgi:RND family efflux transporter MFP subunit
MARHNLSAVIRYLKQLAGPAQSDGASDAALLERYVHRGDEAAFELLLWRHGALVFNVCRRILPCEQDAEDAFQATFLAFVRKAGSISRRGSVASWLYKVAYRIALEARGRAQKTAATEKSSGEGRAVAQAADPLWSDVRPILDEELNRLPERLRRPIVLCYLEGKSNEEAARELDCRLGTIYSRLSRGRELLRHRLQRRGVTLPIAALIVALTAHAVEAAPALSLVRAAARAALVFADPSAATAVSPHVATLAEGVLRTMLVTKLKIVAVMLLVIGVAAGGVWTQARTTALPAEAKADQPPPKPKDDDKKDAKPIPVKVVKPKKGGSTLTETWAAEVVAAQQQQIGPLVSGTVKEVLVNIGDHVKKGQTLIVLDAPLLATEVEEAKASLELARAQMVEAEAVLAEADKAFRERLGANPQKARASLSATKAKGKLAQAILDKAKIQASFTQLKAAFDGVVTRRTIDPGNYVQPSDSRLLRPLLTIQRLDMMRILFQVSPEQVSLIKRGRPVEVEYHLPGLHGREYKISRFSSALEGGSVAGQREMTVEIDIPNADNRLLPGMSGQVKIHQQPPPNTLVVPRSSVAGSDEDPEGLYLWIVRDGKAHRMPVTFWVIGEKNAEIAGGIQEADLVITNPEKLKDGTPVKIEKAP